MNTIIIILGVVLILVIVYMIFQDYFTGKTNDSFENHGLIGKEDIFLIKYDTNGNKQWTKIIDGPDLFTPINYQIR